MSLSLDSNRVQRLAGPTLRFRHVALVGKYHAVGSRDALENIAHFLHAEGCEVSLERDTALNTGLLQPVAIHPLQRYPNITQQVQAWLFTREATLWREQQLLSPSTKRLGVSTRSRGIAHRSPLARLASHVGS